MQPTFFDNKIYILKDDLVRAMRERDVISVVSPVFSMYACCELAESEAEQSLSSVGADLAAAWDALYAQAIFGDTDAVDVDGRIGRQRRIAALSAEVQQLEKRHAREVQPAKRNALFKQLRASWTELAQLEGEL